MPVSAGEVLWYWYFRARITIVEVRRKYEIQLKILVYISIHDHKNFPPRLKADKTKHSSLSQT
jgi:hypothetical protein